MGEKGEIVIYQTQDGITQLDVRLDGDTVWLSQDQMAQLFERDKSVITRHISNIYAEGELPRESTSAKIAFLPQTRERTYEYTIVLDVAEKTIRNYAGEETKLTFRVDIDEESKVNAFSENMDIKSSIIREMWLKDYRLIENSIIH